MNEFIIEEGNLKFDFTYCGKPIKFDMFNNSGLYAVDFVVDRDYLLFIEVKDYQNPKAPLLCQRSDYDMLVEASRAEESVFSLKMGCKIKDSILSLYAKGEQFTKNVIYLLFINFDDLKAAERQLLFERLRGQIPTGLNNERFSAFREIKFQIVDARHLRKYGIICSGKTVE